MSKSKFVDFRAVKRQLSMVQVLEHYGLMSQMHQDGDSITGACPIHGGQNKTAFRVSIRKNCWNCFSQCASGGNVLDFVARKENVSLLRAANLLVEWFNLKVGPPGNESDSPASGKRESVALSKSSAERERPKSCEADEGASDNKPLEFVLKNLQSDHPYLAERGLTPETIQTFGLGFCSKGLQKDRIVIPIHNASGQLVAYAGRWPGNSDQPRYQLPKGFKKSLELFNLHRAIAEPADRPLVIVEGYFDCMKLWQHGVKRVVALMGSSLSPAQEELLKKYTRPCGQIIIVLDEDDAGQKARDEIATRLAKFAFVRIHVFDKPGMQPEHLSAEQIRYVSEVQRENL